MDGRRTLTFSSLDEMMAEVDRLLAGHRTLGKWSLGQICNHLSGALQGSIEGIPYAAPWPVRKLVGPIAKRLVLRRGRLPAGARLPRKFAPKSGLDARAEAEALRASVRYYSAHNGPFASHPVFGRMTAEEWLRFQCIHAAHHLGFVVPDPAGPGKVSPEPSR